MLKIHAVASTDSGPVTTKTALRTLVKDVPSAVRVTPAHPSPLLPSARTVDGLMFGIPVTVHVGKSTAEVERKFNGAIVVR